MALTRGGADRLSADGDPAAPGDGVGLSSPEPAPPKRPQRRSRADKPPLPQIEVPFDADEFVARIRALAKPLWRDLPWRSTHDPYKIWLSEVMLQQTQVPRVLARWDAWLERFPTVAELAAADDAEVLEAWQGMGYNRRALALHRTAVTVARERYGSFPHEVEALLGLPGIGPSTAAGIRAFAFDLPGVYIETNVRAVFIHELFPSAEKVPDAAIVPLVRATCPGPNRDVRGWYWALLDYGAWLKHQVANPTRRSGSYARQSRFEGSNRQKRAEVVRILLASRDSGEPLTTDQVAGRLDAVELAAGRPPVGIAATRKLLVALEREGFCSQRPRGWVAGGSDASQG